MRLSMILMILLINFAKRLVCLQLKANYINSKDVFCEDQCTDGLKCLSSNWFDCKWRQVSDPTIVCCLNRQTSGNSYGMKTSGHYMQINCANRNRQHLNRVFKRSFWHILNNLFAQKTRPGISHYPWMVSVQAFEGHICGGAIITDQIVVTAAHCFRPLFDSSVYSLKIGSNRLTDGQKILVDRIIQHELYFQSESYHDIALIVTKNVIKFDKTIDIICLPTIDISMDHLVGRRGTVVGFGNTDYRGVLSQTLKQINVQIIDNKNCAQSFAMGDKHNIPVGIQECMICGNSDGPSDACQGDSGGPMSIAINGVHNLIGIVSFGRKCGSVDMPGVYTNVIYYRKWIFGQIAKIET